MSLDSAIQIEVPERLKWLEESRKITENRKKYRPPVWASPEGYVRGRK